MSQPLSTYLADVEERRALIHALAQLLGFSAATGAMTDDDSAATNGTAVEVLVDGGGFAHLESINAGEADAIAAIGEGGPEITVTYAAAPAGVQLYYDEDPGEFLAVLVPAEDVYVVANDGRTIKINHDADAAVNGVAVYFDDDAANDFERLLFVSPTNADGAFTTDTATMQLPLTETYQRTPIYDIEIKQQADGGLVLELVAAPVSA